uniref:tape measure protein n=1 Tax=uncultured Clostridium sp. TaxID=59620 RepID=UPI00262EC5C5
MSRTIDERVVEMRFDNRQFESGVQTSLSTLEKLKRGLDLDGAAKGLDELGAAAKKCDMSMLGRSVETVQAKFSAFEVVAMTALSNITNSAVNAGKRLLSSLTIEPISTGFSEYELKMGSIQTIMASTGESLDKVNQKLDELNRYSDRTIYSFSDMTSNIGKFTNAGVKLDDAVSAIQGVSNVAAVSGANANEASRAMYNFAQALSAGYVKLIDWKSIENANMATVEFKTQLLEAAVAAGTVTKTTDGMYQVLTKNGQGGTMKETIDATHMFNDSLAYQWMTTEVLTETLKDYADETTEIGKKAFAAAQDVKTWTQLLDTLKESAQSGWAETWQLVAGDYEEAKATLRTFSEFFSSIIDGSAEARNSLLEGALMSSWGQLKNRVNETGISVDTFRDTLRETAEESVEGLDKMIEEAGSFDAALSKGWLTTDILSDTLDNLVSKAAGTQVTISELSDEQLQNIGYTQEQVDALRALSEEVKSSDSNLASLVSTMDRQSGRELLFDSLLNGAKAIQGLFKTIKGAWQDIFPPATSEQLYSFIEALHSASEKIRDFFTQAEEGADGFTGAVNKPLQDIGNTFKGLFAVLDIVKQAFSALWRVITPAGSIVGGLLTGVLGLTGSFGECLVKLDEAINKGDIFYNGLKFIVDIVKGAITAMTSFAAAIGESLGFPGLDGATASVEAFLGTLKEKVGAPGFEKLQAIFDGICTRAKWVKDAIVGMKDGVVDSMGKIDGAVSGNKFVQVLTGIGTLIRQVASAIGGLLGKAIDGLINTLSNANFNGILDFLNALAAGGIIAAIN